MNTALTPQPLYLPHRQIAELSARRHAETEAFERDAAQLRPSWAPAAKPDEVTPGGSSQRIVASATNAGDGAVLHQILRRSAAQRADAEADVYSRQLLRDLDRTQRNVRRLLVAMIVGAFAVIALTDSGTPTHAPDTRSASSHPLPAE